MLLGEEDTSLFLDLALSKVFAVFFILPAGCQFWEVNGCACPFFFFSRESFPVQLFIASPFSLAQGIFLFQNMGSKKPSTLCRLPIQLYCASTSAYSTSSRSSAPNSKPRQVSWFLSPGVLFLHKATGIEFLSCYEEKNHRLKYRKILS